MKHTGMISIISLLYYAKITKYLKILRNKIILSENLTKIVFRVWIDDYFNIKRNILIILFGDIK